MGDEWVDPEEQEMLERADAYAALLKKISGIEPGNHRRMDAMDAEWKYMSTYSTWACLSVATDPPMDSVEIEVSAEVPVGLATVQQVVRALKSYRDVSERDLYKAFEGWRWNGQARREGHQMFSDRLRQEWRDKNEDPARIARFGRYSDMDVNFFLYGDRFNDKIERLTEINWGGHDFPHWEDISRDDRKSPLVFTSTRWVKMEPTAPAEKLEHLVAQLCGQQHAMIRRFIQMLQNETTKVKT